MCERDPFGISLRIKAISLNICQKNKGEADFVSPGARARTETQFERA